MKKRELFNLQLWRMEVQDQVTLLIWWLLRTLWQMASWQGHVHNGDITSKSRKQSHQVVTVSSKGLHPVDLWSSHQILPWVLSPNVATLMARLPAHESSRTNHVPMTALVLRCWNSILYQTEKVPTPRKLTLNKQIIGCVLRSAVKKRKHVMWLNV